jgi:hypothetical protein
LAGVFAVVSLGKAGDEGGFADVGGAEEDYFEFGSGDFYVGHLVLVVVLVVLVVEVPLREIMMTW